MRHNRWARLVRTMRAVIADERGGVAVYVAVAMPLLLGSVGLGVDVGLTYSSRQSAQTQADAAAMAAALELARGKTIDEARTAATSDAEHNGFVTARGDVITVNSPPATGPFSADATAAEVQITRPVRLTFVGFVGAERDITVAARAVARPVRSDACVWSLEDIDTGIGLTGTADVQLNCGVYARSTSGEAIEQNGSSCLHATSVVTAGGTSGACIHPPPRTNAAQLDDPLGGLPEPTASSTCDHPKVYKITKDETLSQGVYCGGIQVSGNAKVKIQPWPLRVAPWGIQSRWQLRAER
jgi:Flp pilus assembly protein TadG